jgi:hypothetical protein
VQLHHCQIQGNLQKKRNVDLKYLRDTRRRIWQVKIQYRTPRKRWNIKKPEINYSKLGTTKVLRSYIQKRMFKFLSGSPLALLSRNYIVAIEHTT